MTLEQAVAILNAHGHRGRADWWPRRTTRGQWAAAGGGPTGLTEFEAVATARRYEAEQAVASAMAIQMEAGQTQLGTALSAVLREHYYPLIVKQHQEFIAAAPVLALLEHLGAGKPIEDFTP